MFIPAPKIIGLMVFRASIGDGAVVPGSVTLALLAKSASSWIVIPCAPVSDVVRLQLKVTLPLPSSL